MESIKTLKTTIRFYTRDVKQFFSPPFDFLFYSTYLLFEMLFGMYVRLLRWFLTTCIESSKWWWVWVRMIIYKTCQWTLKAQKKRKNHSHTDGLTLVNNFFFFFPLSSSCSSCTCLRLAPLFCNTLSRLTLAVCRISFHHCLIVL